MPNLVQSVERALMLLNQVAWHGDWVGLRELARGTGLKVPTAQNLLKTLQAYGFLEFDERMRRYRIGLAALRLVVGHRPPPGADAPRAGLDGGATRGARSPSRARRG